MGNSNYIVHFCSYKEIEDLLLRHSFSTMGRQYGVSCVRSLAWGESPS